MYHILRARGALKPGESGCWNIITTVGYKYRKGEAARPPPPEMDMGFHSSKKSWLMAFAFFISPTVLTPMK